MEDVWAIEGRRLEKLHNEEVNCFYSSQEIIRLIKPRIMRAVQMEEERNAYWVLMAKSDGVYQGGRSGTVGQKEKPDPST